MASPVDARTVALRRPVSAPAPPTTRVPAAPVTARVPRCRPTPARGAADHAGAGGRPATAPAEPVTARVPVAAPPTAPNAGSRPGSRVLGGRSADDAGAAGARVPGPPSPLRPRWPSRDPRPGADGPPPGRRAGPGPPTAAAAALAEVLAGVLNVERVSVDAHFFDDLGADSMVMARFCAQVRKRDDVPSVSIKDVYRHTTISGLAGALAPAAAPAAVPAAARPPRSPTAFAEVLAGVLDVERVSVDAHFFDDLGADSMVMARFCAQARKRDDLPSVSIKDVYRHTTIGGLAGALALAGRRASLRRRHGVRGGAGRSAGGGPVSADATSSTTWAPTRW